MTIAQAIEKIRDAGFTIEAEGDRIAIGPFSGLSESQLVWVKERKGEILECLRAERVVVHVPDFTLSTGKRVSFDLDVPIIHLPALRQSLRFELIGDQGGGSILGAPGQSESELRGRLVQKYGPRLATINGAEVMA